MLLRMLPFVALLGLVACPAPARPADAEKTQPTFVLRIKSINDLLSDVKYVAKMAGQEDKVQQADGMLSTLVTEDTGLQGIDV